MKIDNKNYSAFKENDSLKDKGLQELFDGIRKPAVITPPDIVSQCMVAIPMWLLYEMGLLIARVSTREKKEKKPRKQKRVKRTKQRKQKRRRKL